MEEKKNQNEQNEVEIEIYTLQDEDGAEHEFELIATCEMNGNEYYAMIPADENDKDDEYCEYVVLKAVTENGEKTLVTLDDDDEFDAVADYFDDLLADEIDYDADKKDKK